MVIGNLGISFYALDHRMGTSFKLTHNSSIFWFYLVFVNLFLQIILAYKTS